MASWYESESYGKYYVERYKKNEAIRARYYNEAKNLSMSEDKKAFEISSAERSSVERGVIDIQTLIADILDEGANQAKEQGWFDIGASEIKNELDLKTPYGVLSFKATPTNILLNKIKGQAQLDVSLSSDLTLPNSIIREMSGTGVSSGVASFNLKASGQIKVIKDDIYLTLKSFDLSSNRGDLTTEIQNEVKPYIGVTYKMPGGRDVMRAWSEMDNEELYKDLSILTAKLRTTALLTPYKRLSDGSYALRTNPTPWKSTLKKSSSGIGAMIPRTAQHNFSNLIYTAKEGITLKLDRSSGYQGSANLRADGGYLAMDLIAKNRSTKIEASLHQNTFSWDTSFEDGSSKGLISPTALSAELKIKSLNQHWSATGDMDSVTISEKQGAKIEITQNLTSSQSNRTNKTLITVYIPESYLTYFLEMTKEYSDASLPRNIELRHMIDWTQRVQDITITQPEEYIEIDNL